MYIVCEHVWSRYKCSAVHHVYTCMCVVATLWSNVFWWHTATYMYTLRQGNIMFTHCTLYSDVCTSTYNAYVCCLHHVSHVCPYSEALLHSNVSCNLWTLGTRLCNNIHTLYTSCEPPLHVCTSTLPLVSSVCQHVPTHVQCSLTMQNNINYVHTTTPRMSETAIDCPGMSL